ncbi:Josephin-2 [Coemansia sp. RSA 1085]|nr:Machado-joseph disease protein MJD [Coemansia mojavensis]KAI9472994.1 Machado-joseph disease protein MJD [Coemansia mojavensis]KAJ1738656.1 Josephin-2 [Coemansia sp. RSA 1086]KAJ2645901.1 Josephin-2 [Coemansia sp. RSA 1250]KAJ2667732.1 Josephin-2 [Coemansia sp. RSA 1085]
MKLRDSPIYHEQQSFWLCAKHSLNNVLQREAFTHADLERIAKYLHEMHPEQGGWLKFNSHKNFLGFGYYDINVIIAALNEKGYDLLWHDKRTGIEEADLSNCVGIIVHIQPDWFFRRGHWFAIKYIDKDLTVPIVPASYVGEPRAARSAAEREERDYEANTHKPGFWNLDSKLRHPEYIGDRVLLNALLQKLSKRNRLHVLLVVPSTDSDLSASSASTAPSSSSSL